MNPQNKLHNFHFARKYISRKNNLQSLFSYTKTWQEKK